MIYQYKDKKQHDLLRKTAEIVTDFGSSDLKIVCEKMSQALATQDDGVALAAPQIGVSRRIFVVSHKVLKDNNADMFFFNPTLKKTSKEKRWVEEGCLSVRWKYGKVHRSTKATVQAQDIDGDMFEMSGSGIIAQIFQHEIDHLDGVLFIDKAKDVKEADE
jgi:peptide deformylase